MGEEQGFTLTDYLNKNRDQYINGNTEVYDKIAQPFLQIISEMSKRIEILEAEKEKIKEKPKSKKD